MNTAQSAVAEAESKSQEAADPTLDTFAGFKNSFAYGNRNDLLFKFIKRLPDGDAAEFMRGLLENLGETIDDGNLDRLLRHVYQWNVQAYQDEVEPPNPWAYDDGPFTPMSKPLAECRLGLLTATGNYVDGDDPEPFGMKGLTQETAIPLIMDFIKAPPQLSTIPLDTPRDKIRVRHPGYDVRAVAKDYNVGLPLDRLQEFQREGRIGELLSDAFSFVGATAQTPLLKKNAPEWAGMLKERQVDAMLLVPA